MDYILRGVVRGFVFMLKYHLETHLDRDPLLTEQQYLALYDFYLSILCFLDDEPLTSGYLDYVSPNTRLQMSDWRFLRQSTHSVDPRTGAWSRNPQVGQVHVLSSDARTARRVVVRGGRTTPPSLHPGMFPPGDELNEPNYASHPPQLFPVPLHTDVLAVESMREVYQPTLPSPPTLPLSCQEPSPPRTASRPPPSTPVEVTRHSERSKRPNLNPSTR